MIQVLKVNKQGNKIVSYTCTDGATVLDLTKEHLIKYINNKQVINAKVQMYQGKPIVRVTEAKSVSTNKIKENTSKTNKVKQTDKNELIEFILRAKKEGHKIVRLGKIDVDTETFKIKKSNMVVKTPEEIQAMIDSAVFDYIRNICDNDLASARTMYNRYKGIPEDKLEVDLAEKSEFMKVYNKLAEDIKDCIDKYIDKENEYIMECIDDYTDYVFGSKGFYIDGISIDWHKSTMFIELGIYRDSTAEDDENSTNYDSITLAMIKYNDKNKYAEFSIDGSFAFEMISTDKYMSAEELLTEVKNNLAKHGDKIKVDIDSDSKFMKIYRELTDNILNMIYDFETNNEFDHTTRDIEVEEIENEDGDFGKIEQVIYYIDNQSDVTNIAYINYESDKTYSGFCINAVNDKYSEIFSSIDGSYMSSKELQKAVKNCLDAHSK